MASFAGVGALAKCSPAEDVGSPTDGTLPLRSEGRRAVSLCGVHFILQTLLAPSRGQTHFPGSRELVEAALVKAGQSLVKAVTSFPKV